MTALRAIYKGEGGPGESCYIWWIHPSKNSRFFIN
jgi:hypothetical protein